MDIKAKVLIIDDEQDMRDMLSWNLEQKGYAVASACSGEEGIEKVKSGGYELAILDIKMDGMDGVTTLGEIKKLDPDIEVIMATGYGTMETAIEAMRKGACDYISKPFEVNEMIAVIENAIEKRRLKETVALYTASKAIFSTIKLDDLLEVVIDSAMKALNADDASLMLPDGQGKLYIAISSGLSEKVTKETRLALGERIAGWAAEKKEPLLLISDLKDDDRFKDIKGREKIKSSIVFPLIGKTKQLLGILNVNRISIEKNFTESDLHKANIFSSLVSLAIENANLYKELQEAQAQLFQSEKLSALGELTASLTHELNQPLNVMKIISQSTLRDIEKGKFDSKSVKEDLPEIINQVDKMSGIIDHMRVFTRRRAGEAKQMLDVNDALEGALKIIGQQLKNHNIQLVRELGQGLPWVKGDPIMLEQVIMNLINNARDALDECNKEGKKLEIKTYKIDNQESIVIEVRDNGPGIPEDIKNKIFEPFVTSKEAGKGTGLGLSVSKRIVEEHKGKIEYESVLNEGTAFKVVLPIFKG